MTRTRLAWARMRYGALDALYSLVQPRQVPPKSKSPPRPWVEILVTVLGLAGWCVFLLFYEQVSPVAGLDLRYDRGEIARIAEEYVTARGLDVTDHRRAMSFGPDWMVQIYLERTVGVPRMSQLVRDKQVRVWSWYVRWFVPEQREEVRVYLLPTGEVVGFSHILPEDAAGPAITPEEAQQIAEDYLIEDRELVLGDWELYDVSATTLPNRTDHTMIWVRRGLEVGEGDVRISVTIKGDEVGLFDRWFRVPEAFSRAYAEQRSRAELLDNLSYSASWLFVLGGFLVLAWGLYVGLKIGWLPVIAGTVAGMVDLLDSLNGLPLIGVGYNTAVDYSSYLFSVLGAHLDSAVSNALTVGFLVVASRWLLRAVWPREHKLVPEAPDQWARFARSSWRGLMLGGLMAAYLILFYTGAKALGAWSPVRTPSLDLLATPVPFVHAIYIGLLPALKEELKYRALGIGLTMRLTGGRVFLALLLPSLLWGFAHSSYLTDPISLRGVELTLSSLLLTGLFFLLFDITTSIVAHYSYNASLTAIVLIRSGEPSLVITGLVAFLLGVVPVLIVLFQRLVRKRGEEVAGLTISVGSEGEWAQIPGPRGPAPGEEAFPRRLVCLRTEDGRLAGYAVGAILPGSSEGEVGTVMDIFVAGRHRGQYHGTALYQALVDWLREQGVTQVHTHVPVGNAGASTFWTVQGFRPVARVWCRELTSPVRRSAATSPEAVP